MLCSASVDVGLISNGTIRHLVVYVQYNYRLFTSDNNNTVSSNVVYKYMYMHSKCAAALWTLHNNTSKSIVYDSTRRDNKDRALCIYVYVWELTLDILSGERKSAPPWRENPHGPPPSISTMNLSSEPWSMESPFASPLLIADMFRRPHNWWSFQHKDTLLSAEHERERGTNRRGFGLCWHWADQLFGTCAQKVDF